MTGLYNCKRVSQLVSESFDHELPFWIRIQLQMHFAICGICVQFRKTMVRIDHSIKQQATNFDSGRDQKTARLPPKTRVRIKRQFGKRPSAAIVER